MDDQQHLDSQSLKDRAWTTDEIRKNSSNWTLAGDVGLYNLLKEFSHHVISRTHEVENAMDSLVHQTKMTSAKINNVINDFHMLSNLQFVENRVYDEEIQEPVPETKPVVEKTKEQREAEMLPKILQAVELGLAVLDTAFERINVNEISDSEDEDVSSEGHTILEPKDPYEHRPLPYIIGSEEFMKCDYAGLKDLVEDEVQSFSEESSISETDETSSEGEPLPLDEEKFPKKPNDRMLQNLGDNISSSEESELFGSEKEVNGYASDASLEFKSKEKNIEKISVEAEPEKGTRQNSVSSLQSKLKLPQVLPMPKPQEKRNDDGDLFMNDEDISDDESPFRKKTGLFSSDVRFNDEKDADLFGGDLFGKSPKESKPEIKSEVYKPPAKKLQTTNIPEKKKPILFDNDEDSEDDIFNTLMKTKKPSPRINNAGSQESPEKADTSSTPSSAPSTKPSGNAFDFVTGAGNSNSLFDDDSDGDDLFSSKKTQKKTFEFDTSESDDLFGIISSKASKESKGFEEKSSLFQDTKAPEKPESKGPLLVKKKTKDSIFEDSDSSDQEKQIPVASPLAAPVKKKPEMSLFGDDDELEDDIFSQVKKSTTEPLKVKTKTEKQSLFVDELKKVQEKKSTVTKDIEKPKTLSLFDDTDEVDTLGFKETSPVKTVKKSKNVGLFDSIDKNEDAKTEPVKEIPAKSSLFEDDIKKESPQRSTAVPKTEQNKSLSLFEDSDNFDLFAPKPSVKKSETKLPVKESKPVEKLLPEIKDETDGATSSKISSSAVNVDSFASFDTPIDSSNVLNVVNKGRVKMTAKRRKPTRQGRLAALENVDKEKIDTEPPSTKSDISSVEDNSNSLFSSTSEKKSEEQLIQPAKLDYKSQEKKKMNLMSQLISEVVTSKVGSKMAAAKEEEDEDEDIDIFSEATKKDRSKSSFSFRPPEENAISSMFPIEKKSEEKDELDISKSDSFEDDFFFTEPAFKNFRSSISHKDPPVLDLEDGDDDDDDLFSAIKGNVLPKAKPETTESNDLFDDDDTDIFANIQKEKYEMFPKQIYDDEDDDIFGNVTNIVNNKPKEISSNSSVKKVEKQQVNAFDDPLTGLLGDN